MPDWRRVLLPLVFLPAAGGVVAAQCAPQWLPGDACPAPHGRVTCSALWDPDGAGPLPQRYVAGGSFDVATTIGAAVATHDGARWTVLGALSGTCTALAVHAGQLRAAVQTGANASVVYTWNGGAWQPIGAATGVVHAMTTLGSDLVIGGQLTAIDAVGIGSVARWNGTTWTSLGSLTGTVRALAVFNGSLYAGGVLASGRLWRWNGTWWSAGPSFNGEVTSLAVRSAVALHQTYLFVGGAFTSFSIGAATTPAQRVARLEAAGQTWSGVYGGVSGSRVMALSVRNVGLNGYELVAAVEDPVGWHSVKRLSGAVWSSSPPLLPPGDTVPTTIVRYADRYTVGLRNSTFAVRAWDGAAWQPVTGDRGIDDVVVAVASAGDDLVIGGPFATIDGVTVNGIARGSAGNWAPLGAGVAGGAASVRAVAIAANGDVIAAGDFTSAGGQPANRIARWNGTTWSPLGAGLDAVVHSLLVLPNGDLFAGGDFVWAGGVVAIRAARWNGSAWSALATGGFGFLPMVRALAVMPDGTIVAAGESAPVTNHVVQLVGDQWTPLGVGFDGFVTSLAIAPNGDLLAGGQFGFTSTLQRWSGGSWLAVPIGTEIVRALAMHPSGDLFVGQQSLSYHSPLLRVHTNGLLAAQAIGGSHFETVYGCVVAGDGDVIAVGSFSEAAGAASSNVARLHVPCPAIAVPYGSACSGLTATVTLTALEGPWVGGASRLRSSTYGSGATALRVIGMTQLDVPLLAMFSGALPGCVALAAHDVVEPHVPVGGVLTVVTPVPATSTLIGMQSYEQVLQVELVPGGFAVSSSNGIALTIGSL